ncbi:similar to Saccharomyces cerevisiae YKL080W VMA5 Subunit C of the eight-subunit V1 peripheral membrane domain of vacuolar H+-ATPase (V-ATPase) [Geotrichum candidum]|uniref:V-type proton ATPase subunit C n=1 Tax=Geotrichum candidum TaxID=1173061 RepID=A0A0J9XEF9_GEOCN|nr:similar to Saccharomyces cerevisiae YKL080W VMA5 Subunit C of the eight-subunit V1 peripheral membrane domain of vacuolar H+-ATPase (V-ATPase) [Geotrichum candidum]
MSNDLFYLISLPQNAAPNGGDPELQLESWYAENLNISPSDVTPFNIPVFKIGTLDSLVQQSEELAKLDGQFHGVVSKLSDIIDSVYEGNAAKIASAKKVNGKSPEAYIKSFSWTSSKYRVDKSIPELVDLLSKDTFSLDAEVRSTYANYTAAKTNLTTVDRKQTGNLSVRSLHDVVKREHFVQESEYLTTILIAVPKSQTKEFLSTYETLTPMVVPRSASLIASDDEYALFNTTLFKKYVNEFTLKAREHKWTPREFKYSEEFIADLRQELQKATEQERKLWGDVVRLSQASYNDIIQNWTHLKAIHIFVEAVLRYGLPPNFINTAILVSQKHKKKVQDTLIAKFGYLGGNAFQKDKNGKLKADTDLHEYGAIVDAEYKPFVYEELELFA